MVTLPVVTGGVVVLSVVVVVHFVAETVAGAVYSVAGAEAGYSVVAVRNKSCNILFMFSY